MPLLDHFRPPLSERRPWESFAATWAGALADSLNQDILPPGFIALEQVPAGADDTASAASTVWTPAAPPVVLPTTFPPGCTVQILDTGGGRTLVAAIELVSPGNKDRADKRRLFAAKCATYLSRGIGLIVVDVVTNRQGNLHNDLMDLLGLGAAFQMAQPALYSVAYRPLQVAGAGRIETWPHSLAVGQPLPALPLSLEAEHCVQVDLETSYTAACARRRVNEATEGS